MTAAARHHRFERAARSSRVVAGRFTPAEVGGQRVLLARLDDGAPVAFAATCPHQGQPLTLGEIEDGCVVCPHHRYAYDPRTGRNVHPGTDLALRLPTYPTRERGGWVWVALSPPAPPATVPTATS